MNICETLRYYRPELSIAFFIACLILLIGYAVSTDVDAKRQFRAACEEINGVAVWNGKYLECLPKGRTQ